MRSVLWIVTSIMILCSPIMEANAEQPVILKARTGNMVVAGQLIGFSDSHYVITSRLYGTMTVDAKLFECIGNACPKAQPTVKKKVPLRQSIEFGIHGSTSMGIRLAPRLIEAYSKRSSLDLKRNPGTNVNELQLHLENKQGKRLASIDLKAYGSSTSFSSLKEGKAQIGMSSRPAKKFEIAGAKKNNGRNGLKEHVVALDAITIIVSRWNKVSSLSVEQVAKIFSGEIRDWSEIGGAPGVINIYSRNRKSGIFDSFYSLVLEPTNRNLASNTKFFSSSDQLSAAVAADPRGIGYVGYAFANGAKKLALRKSCGLQKNPTAFNIKTQEYPLTRKLYFYTTSETTHPIAKKFINFAISKDAEKIISSSGFIDQSIGSIHFDHISERLLLSFGTLSNGPERRLLQKFVKTFRHSKRLTTTLRFEETSFELDAHSIGLLFELGNVIFREAGRSNKIYLVGFSDSAGDFEQNKQISLLRAQQVKNILLDKFSGLVTEDQLTVQSYGQLLPMDCNDTPEGRARNRRVEIWVPQ